MKTDSPSPGATIEIAGVPATCLSVEFAVATRSVYARASGGNFRRILAALPGTKVVYEDRKGVVFIAPLEKCLWARRSVDQFDEDSSLIGYGGAIGKAAALQVRSFQRGFATRLKDRA